MARFADWDEVVQYLEELGEHIDLFLRFACSIPETTPWLPEFDDDYPREGPHDVNLLFNVLKLREHYAGLERSLLLSRAGLHRLSPLDQPHLLYPGVELVTIGDQSESCYSRTAIAFGTFLKWTATDQQWAWVVRLSQLRNAEDPWRQGRKLLRLELEKNTARIAERERAEDARFDQSPQYNSEVLEKIRERLPFTGGQGRLKPRLNHQPGLQALTTTDANQGPPIDQDDGYVTETWNLGPIFVSKEEIEKHLLSSTATKLEDDDHSPPPSAAGGYLGLSIDDSTESLRREGFERPLLYSNKSEQWNVIMKLVPAGSNGLSVQDRKRIEGKASGTWRTLMRDMNRHLSALNVKITNVDRVWRLVDLPETAAE